MATSKWELRIFSNARDKRDIIGRGPDMTRSFKNKKLVIEYLKANYEKFPVEWFPQSRFVNVYLG